jgi:hypothetical protein
MYSEALFECSASRKPWWQQQNVRFFFWIHIMNTIEKLGALLEPTVLDTPMVNNHSHKPKLNILTGGTTNLALTTRLTLNT